MAECKYDKDRFRRVVERAESAIARSRIAVERSRKLLAADKQRGKDDKANAI
jgi:hypothetical protein